MDLLEKVEIYSVSQITNEIKTVLSQNYYKIWVIGEIGQCTLSASGHFYFSLKDEDAVLSAVLFKGSFNKLDFDPKVGQKVECFGSISVYPPTGRYQFIVEQAYPIGDGQLAIDLQQLKDKFQKEGLFDESRKKKIPKLIQKIAVVTSPHANALQDFLKTINNSFNHFDIMIYPSLMQGHSAVENILTNLEKIKQNKEVEVIVICRGGGGKEDLAIFNDERIARKIADCNVCVITAIGHELDISICDLVADVSVSTPTSAAKLIVDKWQIFIEEITTIQKNIEQEVNYRINHFQQMIEEYPITRFKNLISNKISFSEQNLFFSVDLINKIITSKIKDIENQLSRYSQKIEDVSPTKILKKGFAVVYQKKDKKRINKRKYLKKKDKIQIRFQDGFANAEIL